MEDKLIEGSFYRLIIDYATEGVVICNEDNRIVDCNEAFCDIIEYKKSEVVGLSFPEFICQLVPDKGKESEFVEKLSKQFDEYQKTGKGKFFTGMSETFIRTKSGTIKRVRRYNLSVKRKRGYLFVVFVGDITDLWKKEEEIRERDRLYRSVFENANDAILILKGDQFIDCNSKILSVFGCEKKEEVINKSPWELSPIYQPNGESSSVKAKKIIELALSGRPQRFYWKHLKVNGELIDTEVSLSVVDREKRILIAIIRDLSFQKSIEKQLRQMFLVLEQSPVSVILTDLDGNIEYVNPWFEKITGYSLEEVKGKNPRILKSGKTTEEEYKRLWETISSGKIWKGEFLNVKKNGDYYWESAIIGPVKDENGKIINYFGIKEDITEVKRLQEQLAQAQRMESIGTLTTGIAHDFNNILTAINGYIELIKMTLSEDNPVYQDILSIEQSSNRAANLVKQLLAFSRKQVVKPRVVNISSVIEELSKLLQRMIGEDIHLKLDLEKNIWSVVADPSQVEQIIINLTVNGRDAIREAEEIGKRGDKYIKITTKNMGLGSDYVVRHPGSRKGKFVMFSVTDSGIGMSEKVMERMFDPFFTTKPRGKGTGMGLATVYGIVKQNKGFVYAYSEEGMGTTVKIYWPVSESIEYEEEEMPVESGRAEGGAEKILIVEDDEMILNFAVKALEKLGYTVVGVSNGKEALEMMESGKFNPDLIMSDVVMPYMGGMELYERLRNQKIRFLFTSGYSDQGFMKGFDGNSDVTFIEKPYSVDNLAHTIRILLKGGEV